MNTRRIIFTFNSNVLLHLREPDLVGMQTGGWGVAQALYCYGTSRYNFGLRKMNEVLTSDYLAPMRVMSPAQAKNTGQTIGTNNVAMINDMADWTQQMRRTIAAHRQDPGSIHILGFPFEYQVCGAEGKQLVTPDLLVQGEDWQLNAMGMPPPFYRNTLDLQTAPTCLTSHTPDF